MFDVTLKFGSFQATEVEVIANSPAALALFATMFGAGAVSAKMPKSKAQDFAVFVKQRGLTVEDVTSACQICGGDGIVEASGRQRPCHACGGTGSVQ